MPTVCAPSPLSHPMMLRPGPMQCCSGRVNQALEAGQVHIGGECISPSNEMVRCYTGSSYSWRSFVTYIQGATRRANWHFFF